MPAEADSTGIDTTVLRVAVMPAMSCLPVYYAERSGLADSLGLEMELLRYQAQMDIDTAIINGHVDVAFTDLIRCTRLSKQVTLTFPEYSVSTYWHILANTPMPAAGSSIVRGMNGVV